MLYLENITNYYIFKKILFVKKNNYLKICNIKLEICQKC